MSNRPRNRSADRMQKEERRLERRMVEAFERLADAAERIADGIDEQLEIFHPTEENKGDNSNDVK